MSASRQSAEFQEEKSDSSVAEEMPEISSLSEIEKFIQKTKLALENAEKLHRVADRRDGLNIELIEDNLKHINPSSKKAEIASMRAIIHQTIQAIKKNNPDRLPEIKLVHAQFEERLGGDHQDNAIRIYSHLEAAYQYRRAFSCHAQLLLHLSKIRHPSYLKSCEGLIKKMQPTAEELASFSPELKAVAERVQRQEESKLPAPASAFFSPPQRVKKSAASKKEYVSIAQKKK